MPLVLHFVQESLIKVLLFVLCVYKQTVIITFGFNMNVIILTTFMVYA